MQDNSNLQTKHSYRMKLVEITCSLISKISLISLITLFWWTKDLSKFTDFADFCLE